MEDKIEPSEFYDSKVNDDIERFYKLNDDEQSSIFEEAFELYFRTKQWALSLGIYEGSDAHYDGLLSERFHFLNSNMNNMTEVDKEIIKTMEYIVRKTFPNLMYKNSFNKLNNLSDLVLVIRGTEDADKCSQVVDDELLDKYFKVGLNKNIPKRKFSNGIYKHSLPFQTANSDLIFNEIKNYYGMQSYGKHFYCCGYGKVQPDIIIPSRGPLISKQIEVKDQGNNLYTEYTNIYGYDKEILVSALKPATFSEVIALVVARRYPKM